MRGRHGRVDSAVAEAVARRGYEGGVLIEADAHLPKRSGCTLRSSALGAMIALGDLAVEVGYEPGQPSEAADPIAVVVPQVADLGGSHDQHVARFRHRPTRASRSGGEPAAFLGILALIGDVRL